MSKFIIKILRAKYTNLFVITLILTISFIDINLVEADGFWGTIGEIGAGAISGPLGLLNKALGVTGTQLASKLLTSALAFDNFFSVGVTAGWETVRDFANLFFALVLLVIAISTVLDIGALSNYSAKRMLPSFIITVLLINFSKSIVAIFVDISQIIMLEFYNAIVAGNGGIHDVLLNQGNLSSLQDNNWFDGQVDALATNLITFFLLLIVTFVLLWIALTLWVRVATIWILIMTSPLAFMSMTFPPLKSIWSKWMSELQKVLVEGPTLLFYLYLAIVVLRASGLNSVASGKLDISSYAVSIILFIIAKTKSEEAAASAPGFAKNIVNTVGSVATLGLSKPAGVGGNMNTGELFKAGREGVDKGISRLARAGQVVSGGKWRWADEYAIAKRRNQEKIDSGQYGGVFRGMIQQTSEKGRQAQQEDTELREFQKRLNDPNGEKLSSQEMSRYNSLISKKTDEIKDNSFNQHAMDMLDAVKRGDTAMVQAISNAGATDLKAFEKALISEDSNLKNLSMPEILSKLYTKAGIRKNSVGYKQAFNKVSSISKGQKSSAAKEIQAISSMQNDPEQSVRDDANQIFNDDGTYNNKNMVTKKLINADMSVRDRVENLTNDPASIRRFIEVSTERDLSNKRIYDNLTPNIINSLLTEARNNPSDQKSIAILQGINGGKSPTPSPTPTPTPAPAPAPTVPLSSKNINSFKKDDGRISPSKIINEILGYPISEIEDPQNWTHLPPDDKNELLNYLQDSNNKSALGIGINQPNNQIIKALIKGLRL